jgi:hypothetical protein
MKRMIENMLHAGTLQLAQHVYLSESQLATMGDVYDASIKSTPLIKPSLSTKRSPKPHERHAGDINAVRTNQRPVTDPVGYRVDVKELSIGSESTLQAWVTVLFGLSSATTLVVGTTTFLVYMDATTAP